jgi:hypothetical protein
MEHKQMYGPNRPTTTPLLGILEGHSDGMPLFHDFSKCFLLEIGFFCCVSNSKMICQRSSRSPKNCTKRVDVSSKYRVTQPKSFHQMIHSIYNKK